MGLCLASWCRVKENIHESIRIALGCKRTSESEHRSLSSNTVELANEGRAVSTGLHARRATGLPGAERGDLFFIRTASVARWSREGQAACKAERSSAVFLFFF